MNTTRIRTLTRRLAAPPDRSARPSADADLLTRFLDAHDEAAFEVLVARHLPAVRAVCRSLLRDPNDVDDATQATFLVLVRRAAAVRNRNALGGWLCRVAWRTANRLRAANVRRAAGRIPGLDPDATPARPTPSDGGDVDVATVLEDEVRLLPEKYRLAVLTCYAGGTPTAEAAARLGWPKGTLLTRLAWARRRLRDRLARRGVTLAGGFVGAFAARSGPAGAALLAGRITPAAVAVACGDPVAKELVSERVRSLTEGVVRTMIGTKLKAAVGIGFLAVALLGLGLGRLTVGTADAAGPGDKKLPPTSALAAVAPAAPEAKEKAAPADADRVEAPPAAPGNDLVVRRPLGSYTREVAGYGKATLTFTENRLHLVATVRIDKVSFTVSADADYTMNRESMVYGIITGADVSGPFDADEGAEIALIAGAATDMPFAFRVRADEDAITIKDIKFGPFGSPLLAEVFGGKGEDKQLLLITSIIGGKYKVDPHPERIQMPPPQPLKTIPDGPAPKLKRQRVTTSTAIGFPPTPPGSVVGPVAGPAFLPPAGNP
ncbi:MAG: sigW 3 [Gemmataceae bacterium]|nr:sigW 3 [Gemmataceae bacterium]